MDELHRALGDIRSLRRQIAHSTEFRGYGPLTLSLTALLGVAAAIVQAKIIPDPVAHVHAYLALWVVTAGVSVGIVGLHAVTRSRRMHSGMADEMIRLAAAQFLPCIAIGLALTWVIVYRAPLIAWTLPAMWQILFSFGVFASCRFLSRTMVAAGVWYAAFGVMCISLGDERALAPWTMGVGFGIGQMIVAAVLAFASAREEEHEIES